MKENTEIPFIPNHQIRAFFDDDTIRVYQAYSSVIADSALSAGRFVTPPFKLERMTWIKPSFLWMMYRAGWGLKDTGQARILAIDITREGFEWALNHSCLSHADPSKTVEEWRILKDKSPVRIQWDPERNLLLEPQPYRTIQIGLHKIAIQHYVHDWVVRISDVTSLAHEIHEAVKANDFQAAKNLLPVEKIYPEIRGYPIN